MRVLPCLTHKTTAAIGSLVCALVVSSSCMPEPSSKGRSTGSAKARPSIVLDEIRSQPGFDQRVEVKAHIEPASEAQGWVITFRQVWGPPARNMQVQGNSLSFTTIQAPSRNETAPFDGSIVPITASAAGRVAFMVEAKSRSGVINKFVEVFPAFPSPSWPRMALGVNYYLSPGFEGDKSWNNFQGRVGTGPAEVPYLTKARSAASGGYGVRHMAGVELRGRSGAWLGSRDCGRIECHPNEYASWTTTAHASTFTRGITGQISPRRGKYSEACIACHTLGYQPGPENDGFDDRALAEKWTFPKTLSSRNWLEMPPALRERANVQCEHCHGPGWFWTGYGNDVCGQCHDHPPQYMTYAQSKRNKMADSYRTIVGHDPASPCKDCHEAAAFLRSIRDHESTSKPGIELDERPQGVTCSTCHNPHGSHCPKTLRICGEVEIAGLTFNAGQGGLCITCHNGEANIVRGPLLRPFIPGQKGNGRMGHAQTEEAASQQDVDAAPHTPQFQVLIGRSGRFLSDPATPSRVGNNPHMWVPDTCVGCHYSESSKMADHGGHTFKMVPEAKADASSSCVSRPNLAPIKESKAIDSCVRCHGSVRTLNRSAKGDYDGDGALEGAVDEIEGLLSALKVEIDTHIRKAQMKDASDVEGLSFTVVSEKIVVADGNCRPLHDKNGLPMTLPADATQLKYAAFNYLLVARDRSGGLHNPEYCVRLLQNTISSLEKLRGETVTHRWRAL